MTEYRIEELAAVTGTTVRTIQSYRNRGLLDPPRRQGRIALYSDAHVERLALIARLIDRGYSLNAVGELLTGLDRGQDIGDLLGVESVAAWHPRREPVTVTREQIKATFGADDDATLRMATELGVLQVLDADEATGPHEQEFVITNPDLLAAGAELVGAGIPLEAVQAEGLAVQRDIDEIAKRFVRLVADNLLEDGAVASGAGASVTELVARLLPLAEVVVNAQLGPAIERHAKAELGSQLDHLLGAEARATTPAGRRTT